VALCHRAAKGDLVSSTPASAPKAQALTTREERRIPSLDGLRAISITMVVTAHIAGGPGLPVAEPLAHWLHLLGELGVRVFFVISGYLITSILLHELDKRQTIALGKFYFRRTLRLFPAFYAYVLTIVLLQAFHLLALRRYDLLHALTYTMNYHRDREWWLGHCWSLSVEEQFYFLWPALLIRFGRRGALGLAAAFVILGTPIRIALWYAFPGARVSIGETFPTIGDAIAAGCVLGGARAWLAAHPRWRQWQRSPLALFAPLLVIVGYASWPWQRINFVIGPTSLNVGIALCIAWCIDNGSGMIGRFLNARPMIIIGVGSYSIYLWQQLFLKHDGPWPIQRFPLNVLMLALTAAASYFLVEKPFLRLRERLEPRLFKRN
jgi:peptidoglycan/LPS O-acetylase OafA/YrhL